MTNRVLTLTQFIVERERGHPSATGDFTTLLNAIALAGKRISRDVNRAGLANIIGPTGDTNIQNEVVQKLDLIANTQMERALAPTGLVCAIGSEEDDGPVHVEHGAEGRYVALYDPLDGSSNIDVGAPIGTIFSIYRRKSAVGSGSNALEDLLQPGRDLAAAGYVLYGSSTIFVYTTGAGVHVFTLESAIGEFILTYSDLKADGGAKVYSTNEGNSPRWDEADLEWVSQMKAEGYSARYIGALVADFHRNLLRGGIFVYPGDKKSPNGKLRLLYEAAPLSFVIEQAGGKATDGKQRILDIEPSELHQRTPLYIGSASEVDRIMSIRSQATVTS
jgi:fructose-1,6-bisphosphatase I